MADLLPFLPLVDMLDKGFLPVAGGVLDQTAWFIEAAQFYQNEIAKIRTEQLQ